MYKMGEIKHIRTTMTIKIAPILAQDYLLMIDYCSTITGSSTAALKSKL